MRPISRREFLAGAAAGGSLLGLGAAGALAQADKFDLVIKGGEVLDTSQKLRARRDVGIRNALIAALEPEIPDTRAKQLLDAKGKLVLPGLIDMHAHVYPQVSALGLPADELVPYTATTTYVSAGDAGANTFSALKHYIVAQARSRIYAFVHISSIGLSGFPVGEMLNIDYADVDQAAKTLAENPELVLGIKVRESVDVVGANGLEPLKRAILACERSGVRGARVMCHIGNAPGELSALLDLLRPGDILTHAYSGAGNNTVRDGKVLAAALAAKKRGVLIDVGHGGGSFDYTVAEPAIAQGFTPDTISCRSPKTCSRPISPACSGTRMSPASAKAASYVLTKTRARRIRAESTSRARGSCATWSNPSGSTPTRSPRPATSRRTRCRPASSRCGRRSISAS